MIDNASLITGRTRTAILTEAMAYYYPEVLRRLGIINIDLEKEALRLARE